VSTLIRWFPDRRGMATGIAIMGFGGGAMIAKFMIGPIMRAFYIPPDYLGPVSQVNLVTEAGRRMVQVAGELHEVVIIGANDVANMLLPGPQGVYLAGTGNIGVAQTFFTLGSVYFVIMLISAFAYRIPKPGWLPEGYVVPDETQGMITEHDVHIDQALKTPQFWQLWLMLCLNVTAGIGVISVAKTMMKDIFGGALPNIVNLEFAATYVLMISIFNMLGRFFWASTSDYIGRKNTYFIFFGLGAMLYASLPYSAQAVSITPSINYLFMFYAATMLIFTMYGGGFATIPAYLADIFGTKYVGGIHGRLLTAWSTAGVLGPLAITSLRERATINAIHDLASKVDPTTFQLSFGAGMDQLNRLIETKTVTIAKLMEVVPADTLDPTPSLYNQTVYLMAALLVIAFLANAFMRPVHHSHHMQKQEK